MCFLPVFLLDKMEELAEVIVCKIMATKNVSLVMLLSFYLISSKVVMV